MKTRLLIIVGIIAIGMISVFAINNGHDLFHVMNLPYEWHDSFGFTDTNVVRSAQCASEELGWLEPCIDVKMVSDNTAEQLEAILEHCIDSKDLVDTIGLSYDNGTHRIDTVNCKWVDIAKIPKGEIFEMNRNELSQVLDWCNDTSKAKYGFYNFSNETHSVNTSTCEWKEHGTYPTNDSLCVPYVDKWIAGGDWSNKTHYFDTVSCTWKDDPNYDAVNSKGCPQFCPKEKTSSLNEGLDNDFPETRSIVTVQDRPANRTIVPITITEKTTNAQTLDTVVQWNFSLLGIEMVTLNDYWGNLADQYITTELVDQDGNDVVDYSRVLDGQIFYKLSLQYYPAICDDGQKIKGEGGYPEPIPIKNGTTDVFLKSGSMGLYPDSEGKYFFDFVSGFETDVEYHPNVIVISEETKKCQLEIKRGNFTDVYFTHAVFGFED